jgi:hypothetical protein
MAGVGSLLWVRSGKAIAHVRNPNQHGAARLAAATRSTFGPDPADSP